MTGESETEAHAPEHEPHEEGPIPGWPSLAAWDRYRLLSVDFGVQSTDQRIADSIRWHLARFRIHGIGYAKHGVLISSLDETNEQGLPIFQVVIDGVPVAHSYHPVNIVRAALEGIYETARNATRDFLLVHAGVVARDGGALLLPALPNTGKSSTTVALLRTGGFSYLSDEFGPIDPVTGRVYPFARPIKIDEESVGQQEGLEAHLVDRDEREVPVWQIGRFVRPQDVGAETAAPSNVRWVVFLSPDRDGPPRLSPVAESEAAAEMAGNCFNLKVFEERSLHLLARIARDAKAFRLEGGTPAERARLLLERLS